MAKRKAATPYRRPKLSALDSARAELAALEVEVTELKRWAQTRQAPFRSSDALGYRVKMGEVQKARDKVKRLERRAARRQPDPQTRLL